MKKLKKILLIIIAVLLVVGACHAILAFLVPSHPGESAPTWVGLLCIIPYVIAAVACGLAVLIIDISTRKNIH